MIVEDARRTPDGCIVEEGKAGTIPAPRSGATHPRGVQCL